MAVAAMVTALLAGAAGGACARLSEGANTISRPWLPTATSTPLGAQPCQAGDVSVGRTRPLASAGREVLLLKFSNRSKSPCVLSGHPRVIATEPGLPEVRAQSGGFFPDPGVTASMDTWEDTNLALETQRDCEARHVGSDTSRQLVYHQVVVTLPGGDTTIDVNLDVRCGLRVSRFGRMPLPGPEYVERCDGRQPRVTGDVDGDGREDRIYHDWIDDHAVVGAARRVAP